MGKVVVNFWRVGCSRFLETAIIIFTLRHLFHLLFTFRLKDVISIVIYHLCFLTSFVLLNFFLLVFYFINSLFKRKKCLEVNTSEY